MEDKMDKRVLDSSLQKLYWSRPSTKTPIAAIVLKTA